MGIKWNTRNIHDENDKYYIKYENNENEKKKPYYSQ